MNRVCRFAALGATLVALVAFLTFSPVRGGSGRAEDRPASAAERSFAEQQERHRFADRPLLTYRTPEGDLLFALQVRPTLPDPPPLPTDYLVVVDTSAGMAGGGLTEAVDVLQALANRIHQHNRGDRVAVWTANLTSRDLTRGFQAGAKVDEAVRQLANEVPLGAVDLPRSLGDAVASFEAGADRRRVVVYLGDGRSVARPLDDDARAALCEAMNRKHAPFVAVPLGGAFDPVNLHALVAGTGGCAVRFRGDDTPVIVAERLRKQAAEPVLYPETFRLPAGVTVALPTRLPPLRRDTATLVVGRLAAGTAALDYQIRGDCQGKTIQHQASLKVPAGDPENHFLAGVYEQWKERKDRPGAVASRASCWPTPTGSSS
ncbi:MAG: vWA domain-containing protein [Gemmataceae bacterium]